MGESRKGRAQLVPTLVLRLQQLCDQKQLCAQKQPFDEKQPYNQEQLCEKLASKSPGSTTKTFPQLRTLCMHALDASKSVALLLSPFGGGV